MNRLVYIYAFFLLLLFYPSFAQNLNANIDSEDALLEETQKTNINDKSLDDAEFQYLDNESLKKFLVEAFKRTISTRNVIYDNLRNNKAAAVCLNWNLINEDFLRNGMYQSIGYSTSESSLDIAIDKAMFQCNSLKIANGIEEECLCNLVFSNQKLSLNIPQNFKIKIRKEDKLVNSINKKPNAKAGIDEGDMIQIDDIPNEFNKWFGIISSDEGGLGWMMWEGTDYETSSKLLDNIPTEKVTSSIVGLTKKLLLSRSRSPHKKKTDEDVLVVGYDGEKIESKENNNFELFYKKITILAKFGLDKEIKSLIEAVPSGLKPEGFLDKIYQIRLNYGDIVYACSQIDTLLARNSKNTDIRKTLLGCQLAKNDIDAAMLSIELLENDLSENDSFIKLVKVLSYEPDKAKNNIDLLINDIDRYLLISLAVAYGKDYFYPYLNDYEINQANRAFLEFNVGSVEDRLIAAEQAAERGVLKPTFLAKLYSYAISEEEHLVLDNNEIKNNDPILRAKLFKLSTKATSSMERARYLSLLWEKAEESGLSFSVIPASILVALTLEPKQELSWFSLSMTKALIISGKSDIAKNWIALSLNNSNLNYEESGKLYGLLMLLAVVGETLPEPYSVNKIAEIWSSMTANAVINEKGKEHNKLLVMMSAIGIKLPKGIWLEYIDNGNFFHERSIPNTALRYQLRESALSNRVAETVALALITLGKDPSKIGSIELNAVIGSLRAIGLEDEAKNLCILSAMDVIN